MLSASVLFRYTLHEYHPESLSLICSYSEIYIYEADLCMCEAFEL